MLSNAPELRGADCGSASKRGLTLPDQVSRSFFSAHEQVFSRNLKDVRGAGARQVHLHAAVVVHAIDAPALRTQVLLLQGEVSSSSRHSRQHHRLATPRWRRPCAPVVLPARIVGMFLPSMLRSCTI